VPKTSVNKYDLATPYERQVRLAWQVLSMQAVAITELPNQAPNNEFGLGILAANRLHRAATHGGVLSHDRRIAVRPD
jgi:hypothetical protein